MESKKVENEISTKFEKFGIKRVHFSGVDSIVEDSNRKFSSNLGPPLRAEASQSDLSLDNSITPTKREKRTLNIIPLYRDHAPFLPPSANRPKSASYSAPAKHKNETTENPKEGRKEIDLKLGLSNMVKETEKKEQRFLEEISEKLSNFSPKSKETEKTSGKAPEKPGSGEKTPTGERNPPETAKKSSDGQKDSKRRRSTRADRLAQLRSVRSRNIHCQTLSDGRTAFVFCISGTSYLVKKQIGRGGYSNVYKVVALKTRKKYAVKHILIKDPSVTANFAREIEILKQLRGEASIIRLVDHESDNENSQLFMVFELAESDVAEFLKGSAPLSVFSARYFWGQMVDAVRVLHEARIVHKDLKPQNFVLVNSSVKLIDFGLANTVSEFTTHIYNEKTEGTPSYMAPECFCSNEGMIAVSRGTDVWSLGIILFEMVVGQTPFHALKGFAKCCAIVNGDAMPLNLVKDPAVLDIIEKCLQRSPDNRPSTEQIIRHPFLAVCRGPCCAAALE